MNTETFDPAKILKDAKDKVAKEWGFPDGWQKEFENDTFVNKMNEVALLAIASVREEYEREIIHWKRDVYGENAAEITRLSKEIERLKADILRLHNHCLKYESELERKDEALRIALAEIKSISKQIPVSRHTISKINEALNHTK